jgi:hypothetical protein
MVPSLSNWPTKEQIQRGVQEFNDAHFAEWQNFEGLPQDERNVVSASRR